MSSAETSPCGGFSTISTESSTYDLAEGHNHRSTPGLHNEAMSPTCKLTSDTEVTFQSLSIDSDTDNSDTETNDHRNQRRTKSDLNIFASVFRRSAKLLNNHNGDSSGARRYPNRFKEFCSWVGAKSYQSISKLFDLDTQDSEKDIRNFMLDVTNRTNRLEVENELVRNDMKIMQRRIDALEKNIRVIPDLIKTSEGAPRPPPPPPPPPPPMAVNLTNRKAQRPNLKNKKSDMPTLHITPQDIANVKLKKVKNVARPCSSPGGKQPLVTQQMLVNARARLGRSRPLSASSPRIDISKKEEPVPECTRSPKPENSPNRFRRRRRIGEVRSSEDLRSRPYPNRTLLARSYTKLRKL